MASLNQQLDVSKKKWIEALEAATKTWEQEAELNSQNRFNITEKILQKLTTAQDRLGYTPAPTIPEHDYQGASI